MVKKLPTPQLIALDLDETLLNQDSRLSQGNRAALEAAVKQGVVIAAATGRAFETVPEEVLRFTGVRYAICSNGAAVYDLLTGETLTRYQLTPEAVAHVLTVAEGENLTYEAFVDGKAYAQRDYVDDPSGYMTDAATVQYVKASRCPVPDILSFIRLHPTELDSLALVVGSMAVKKRIMKKLAAVDGIYVTTSVPRLVEISDIQCGKHRALAFLADYLGIPQERVCAFGNADNDADMLLWAGTGIAVANSSPACLRAADVVTAHYLEDGVAQALKKCFGICAE